METRLVRYESDGPVGSVVLARPQRRNGLTAEMTAQLVEAAEQASEDPAVRVVVLRGEGTHFCVGADLADEQVASGESAQAPGPDSSPESGPESAQDSPLGVVGALERAIGGLGRVAKLMHGMDKVTIASVQGAAAGAGLGLALSCDLRIATDDAVFRTAFLGAGLSGDAGTSWLLPRLVGASRARGLLFLNERLSGEEAFALGLVHRLAPADELPGATQDLADHLASGPPLALAAMKANLEDALRLSFEESLASETRRQAELFLTDDVREAATAFAAKRAPKFRGA